MKSDVDYQYIFLWSGEKVGVMRTTDGTLHFLVNGIDQGPAANGIAAKVYAVIDMYGKCAQVTIVDNTPGTNQENGNDYIPSEA